MLNIDQKIKDNYLKFFGPRNYALLEKDFVKDGGITEKIPEEMLGMLFSSFMSGVIVSLDPKSEYNQRMFINPDDFDGEDIKKVIERGG